MTEHHRQLIMLVSSLADCDGETLWHCRRLRKWSGMLGRVLGLEGESLASLRVAAYFHDIGKRTIRREVLRKPGRLTAQEWEEVYRHPAEGAQILRESGVPFSTEVLAVVSQHHERYDGSGYPYRLEKEGITFGARILAVVDSFDAMTSQRPYRERISWSHALDDLRKHRGTWYDPFVLDTFEGLVYRNGISPAQVETSSLPRLDGRGCSGEWAKVPQGASLEDVRSDSMR